MRDIKEGAGSSNLPRFPAGELEGAVKAQVMTILKSKEIVQATCDAALEQAPAAGDATSLDEAQVTVAMTQIELIWEALFPEEQARILKLLIEKVIVTKGNLELRLRPLGIAELTKELCSSDTLNSSGSTKTSKREVYVG